MTEFIIKIGKVIFFGLNLKTTNGEQPQDWQYYAVGLYVFIVGCAAIGALIGIGTLLLIRKAKERRKPKNEKQEALDRFEEWMEKQKE